MAESFAGDDELVVCLGDNIFEYAEAAAIQSFVDGDDGAAVFVKEVPDPERFGVVVYGDDGRVVDVVEKAGRRRPALRRAAFERRRRRSLLLLAGRLRSDPRAEPVLPGRARDHGRQPPLRGARHARLPPRHRLVGGRRHAGVAARDRRADRAHGRQQARMIEGLIRIPLRRFEDERGWFAEIRRETLLPKPTRQTNLSFSRKGVMRGLHYHERGQDDLFACLQGTARVVVLDRETRRDLHRGHRRRQPGRDLHPRPARARLRGAHRSPLLLPRHRGVRRRESGRARHLLGRPARQAPLEHGRAAPLRAGPAGVRLVRVARGEGVWGNREVPPRPIRRRGLVGETWFPPRERSDACI